MRRQFIVGASFLILGGCDTGGWRRQDDILARGWAEPSEPYKPPQVFCYKTLAGTDCFREPLKGEEERLEGYYGKQRPRPLPSSDTQSITHDDSREIPEKPIVLAPESPHRHNNTSRLSSREPRSPYPKKRVLRDKDQAKENETVVDENKYQRKRYMTKIVQE